MNKTLLELGISYSEAVKKYFSTWKTNDIIDLWKDQIFINYDGAEKADLENYIKDNYLSCDDYCKAEINYLIDELITYEIIKEKELIENLVI